MSNADDPRSGRTLDQERVTAPHAQRMGDVGSAAPAEDVSRLRRLHKASSLVSVVFAALFAAYGTLRGLIHAYVPAVDPERVNYWLRYYVAQHDGAELYFMFASVGACMGVAYCLARWIDRVLWFAHWLPQLLCALPAMVILLRVDSTTIARVEGLRNLVPVAWVLAVTAAGYWYTRLPLRRPGVRWTFALMLGVVLTVVTILVASPPDLFNYGFYIAPASKLAAGERLGTFYMQYNLVGTYLFRALMGFELQAHQMQAVLSILFVVWIGLYYRLSAQLFEDRFLRFTFMCALILVRLLGVDGSPTRDPQVSTIRLDLWVPLALVVYRFGFTSPITGIAFAIAYLADNVFGFLYLSFFGLAWGATLFKSWREGASVRRSAVFAVVAPVAASLAFQWVTFGSFTNPAAKLYQGVHIGMLPIETTSMFWGLAWLLLLAMFPITQDPDAARRRTALFLYAFAASQLTYFFGRSHDHNLINVSGIWLLILFLGLDRLRYCGAHSRAVPEAAVGAVCLMSIEVAAPIMDKYELARSRLLRGVLTEPTVLDRKLDQMPTLFGAMKPGRRVMVFGPIDAYLNYRYRLPQIGYFAPVYANVFVEPTAALLRGRLEEGYEVFGVAQAAAESMGSEVATEAADVLELNKSVTMTSARLRFVYGPPDRLLTRIGMQTIPR
jgi:hypothetical protein